MTSQKKHEYLTTAEVAHLLGVSRVAVFKKIKAEKIRAFKIGRNYVIPVEEFRSVIGAFISPERKVEIDAVVKKAVKEYGETLRLLGKE